MLGIIYQMGQIELTQKGGLLFGYLIGLEHTHRPDGLQPVTAVWEASATRATKSCYQTT
ncbi:MAG: hypothetical protein Sw1PiTSA_28270 [Shewanella algae]